MDVDGNGRRVAVVSGFEKSTTLDVFETAGGKRSWTARGLVSAVAFSRDGKVMATGGKDGVAMLNAATGMAIAQLPHDRPVQALAFSDDGRRLATGGPDSTRVFDVASRSEIRHFDGAGRFVGISADGSRIVTVSGTIARVFDTGSGRELWHATLPGSADSLKVSRDARTLVVTSGNTVRVIDVASGQEVSKVTVADPVATVSFVGEGRDLMIASLPPQRPQVNITRHPLQAQDLIDAACARLTRNLTAAEWAQYIAAESPYRLTCPKLQ
jgi:WD40 repeat protein